MKQLTIILSLVVLCSSVILGQEQFPRSLPKVDISQIWHFSDVPEHNMVYDPLIDDIINQTNLDSLIAYVRILSGEDSVWIDGSKVRIQHRVSDQRERHCSPNKETLVFAHCNLEFEVKRRVLNFFV